MLKQLGADHVINYNENPDWALTARALTPNGDGFDNIIEVGGTDTLSQSVKAIKFEGVISVIGVLSGAAQGNSKIIDALLKTCRFRGLHIGSRVQMEEMMAAIEANKIQPVLDETVFSFEGLRDGLKYLVRLARNQQDAYANMIIGCAETCGQSRHESCIEHVLFLE